MCVTDFEIETVMCNKILLPGKSIDQFKNHGLWNVNGENKIQYAFNLTGLSLREEYNYVYISRQIEKVYLIILGLSQQHFFHTL